MHLPYWVIIGGILAIGAAFWLGIAEGVNIRNDVCPQAIKYADCLASGTEKSECRKLVGD